MALLSGSGLGRRSRSRRHRRARRAATIAPPAPLSLQTADHRAAPRRRTAKSAPRLPHAPSPRRVADRPAHDSFPSRPRAMRQRLHRSQVQVRTLACHINNERPTPRVSLSCIQPTGAPRCPSPHRADQPEMHHGMSYLRPPHRLEIRHQLEAPGVIRAMVKPAQGHAANVED
jgi:hypothetical protein